MSNYFKNKAEEIEQKIHELKVDTKWKCTGEQIQKLIEISLKEVAKDQRYQCIEDINNMVNIKSMEDQFIHDQRVSVLHNSKIKEIKNGSI